MKDLNFNKKEILEKAIKVFSIRVLGYGFGFLFTWVLANKYGARMQGIFAIAFLFLSVGAMFAKLGVETALVKWIANAKAIEYKKQIYITSLKLILVSSVLVGLCIFLLAPIIALMYNKPDVLKSIQLAGLAIPFLAVLDVSGGYFKGEKQTSTFGFYVQFTKYLLPFAFIVIFYFLGIKFIETPMLAYLIGLFIVAFAIVSHILIKFKGKLRKKQNDFSFRFIIFESYPMMISSAIVMIMGWSDVFVLGFFVPEGDIGIYSTAIKLATIVSFTYNAISTIVTPKIAFYYHEKDSAKLRETVSFSSKIMFVCGFPIFLVVFCFPEYLLGFFGPEYIQGKTVLRILLMAQLTNVITGPVGPIFQMTGKQKKLQYFIIIALICNIILGLILVNFISMEGVALASGLGMVIWNALGAFYIWKTINIKTWSTL